MADANLFLGWSGERSNKTAKLLRDLLPIIVPRVVPWMSEEDIQKGAVWPEELNAVLASARTAIFSLTPENHVEPWMLFEAGVIFKAIAGTRVNALLIDLPEIPRGPLTQFQATRIDKEDCLRLVRSISEQFEGEDAAVDRRFEKFWPELEEGLKVIVNTKTAKVEQPPQATERELIQDALTILRRLDKDVPPLQHLASPQLAAQWIQRPSPVIPQPAKPRHAGDMILEMVVDEGPIVLELASSWRGALKKLGFPDGPEAKALLDEVRAWFAADPARVTKNQRGSLSQFGFGSTILGSRRIRLHGLNVRKN